MNATKDRDLLAECLFTSICSSLHGNITKKNRSSLGVYGTENLVVINIQKSQWGDQFYINLSVFLDKTVYMSKVPPENKGDIRFRISAILPEHYISKLNQILDFDNECTKEYRVQTLRNIAVDSVMPIVRSMLTNDGIKKLRRDGILRSVMTSPRANAVFQENSSADTG